jgi:hypothetical protein
MIVRLRMFGTALVVVQASFTFPKFHILHGKGKVKPDSSGRVTVIFPRVGMVVCGVSIIWTVVFVSPFATFSGTTLIDLKIASEDPNKPRVENLSFTVIVHRFQDGTDSGSTKPDNIWKAYFQPPWSGEGMCIMSEVSVHATLRVSWGHIA